MSAKELLTFNERGALANVLAVEEHLAQLPPGVNNSWCAEKHSLAAVDHHLKEAVNHASRISPKKAHGYRLLLAKAERVLQPSAPGSLPQLGAVANLRNDMRAMFGDPTLADRSCSVCSKDRNMSGLGMHPLHPRHPYNNGVPAMGGLGARSWYEHPVVILGGVAALFYALTRGAS
jgi:hypothetical protein